MIATGLFLMQVGYFVAFMVMRPYKVGFFNVLEAINEGYFAFLIMFLIKTAPISEWKPAMILIFVVLMMANCLFVLISIIGKNQSVTL